MADREETIRIRIEFDIPPEEEEKLNQATSQMNEADQKKFESEQKEKEKSQEKKSQEKKVSSDDLSPLGKFSSDHTKKILKEQIKEISKEIRGKKPDDIESLKKELQSKQNTLDLKHFKEGNVGTLNAFTKKQMTNVAQFSSNPGAFFIKGLGKVLGKYGRAGKAGIYGILALFVYELTMLAVDAAMQPGRPLDRRFKRISRLETMNFYDRLLQEEIYHGYQDVRVSTIAGLRGGQSQVNGGYFEFSIGAQGLTSSAARSSYEIQQRSPNLTDARGNPKKSTISGRFK